MSLLLKGPLDCQVIPVVYIVVVVLTSGILGEEGFWVVSATVWWSDGTMKVTAYSEKHSNVLHLCRETSMNPFSKRPHEHIALGVIINN